MEKTAVAEWLALDLPIGQLKALRAIATYGPQNVGELGQWLGLSYPATSLLINKLEQRGLVTRGLDTHDRRYRKVSLTSAGREFSLRLLQGEDEDVTRWLAALTTEELEGLFTGSRGVLRVAESDND